MLILLDCNTKLMKCANENKKNTIKKEVNYAVQCMYLHIYFSCNIFNRYTYLLINLCYSLQTNINETSYAHSCSKQIFEILYMNKKKPKKVGSSNSSRKLFFHGVVHGGGVYVRGASAGNKCARATTF